MAASVFRKLPKLVAPLIASALAANQTDDAERGHRAGLARSSDRQHELPDLWLAAGAHRRRQLGALDLEQHEIAVRIAADHIGREMLAVRSVDMDVLVALDDVVGAHDQAAVGPDDAGRRHALAPVDGHDALWRPARPRWRDRWKGWRVRQWIQSWEGSPWFTSSRLLRCCKPTWRANPIQLMRWRLAS